MDTKHRAVKAATVAFADRGVAGTSLDEIAREISISKQSILYHFGSKAGLVKNVLSVAAEDLSVELEKAIAASDPGWDRIESVVRASFTLAVRRPELLGLLRELSRLGEPWSSDVVELFQPLADEAVNHLEEGMKNGQFRRSDPKLVLVSTYAAVTGVVTNSEALRAVGLELDVRVAARLRSTILEFLRAALMLES